MKLQNLKELEDHVFEKWLPSSSSSKRFYLWWAQCFWHHTVDTRLSIRRTRLSQVLDRNLGSRLARTCTILLTTLLRIEFVTESNRKGSSTLRSRLPWIYIYDQIVRYLLEKGADVSVRTFNKNGYPQLDGLTPLYGAVSDCLYHPWRFFHHQKKS